MKRRIFAGLLGLFVALEALAFPAFAADDAETIEPVYTPSTQQEARCVPVSVPIKNVDETQWHTLYNPETADMMVKLAAASYHIGTDTSWKGTMQSYGYEQLFSTEDNEVYAGGKYPLRYYLGDDGNVDVMFTAINAMIGIQEVTYNGRTRYAVGIVFRGSSDVADWCADFQAYSDLEGYHSGFAQNAADFYAKLSDQVTFQAGGKTYSLTDIYQEMNEPNSDFCMLVMGHSLGGALSNVLVGRHLREAGVHPSNLACYTIAAPRSAPASLKYPYDNIYNIISADDLVPLLTLAGHERIGRDICFWPTDEFRVKNYGSYAAEHPGEHSGWWQTTGFFASEWAPHQIATAYRAIVEEVSAEIAASTPDKLSAYSNYSTNGHNVWDMSEAIVDPYTFGSFTGSLRTDTLAFRGGVIQVTGDCTLAGGLTMQSADDYLLAKGDLTILGHCPENKDHLTAGTVEVKGNFTANTIAEGYGYHATGTHRTVLSGSNLQTIRSGGTDRYQNLYLRNDRVNFTLAIDVLRLAEDALLTATESLTVEQLELNGYRLTHTGDLSATALYMSGGSLSVGGNTKISTSFYVDGTMDITGNLTCEQSLAFAKGQVTVGGDCTLPRSLIMRDESDYLLVNGDLLLWAYDEMPTDHLSAGTVELRGDFLMSNTTTCCNNAYYESDTHKTILSGTEEQIVSFRHAISTDRFYNLCIRNPLVVFQYLNDVRLAENGSLADISQCELIGTLDLNGYKLAAQGTFKYLNKSANNSGLVLMTPDADDKTVTVTRPAGAGEEDAIHVMFTGFDSANRMVICQTMTFSSEEEMTETLQLKNWPDCVRIDVFLLGDNYAPFCESILLPVVP